MTNACKVDCVTIKGYKRHKTAKEIEAMVKRAKTQKTQAIRPHNRHKTAEMKAKDKKRAEKRAEKFKKQFAKPTTASRPKAKPKAKPKTKKKK